MKKKKQYRKFEAETMGMPPLTMTLVNIPEPDPGKKHFGQQNPMTKKMLFKETDVIARIIDHLKSKE